MIKILLVIKKWRFYSKKESSKKSFSPFNSTDRFLNAFSVKPDSTFLVKANSDSIYEIGKDHEIHKIESVRLPRAYGNSVEQLIDTLRLSLKFKEQSYTLRENSIVLKEK